MGRKRYETDGLGEEVDSPPSVAPLAQARTVIERTAHPLGPGPTGAGRRRGRYDTGIPCAAQLYSSRRETKGEACNMQNDVIPTHWP